MDYSARPLLDRQDFIDLLVARGFDAAASASAWHPNVVGVEIAADTIVTINAQYGGGITTTCATRIARGDQTECDQRSNSND